MEQTLPKMFRKVAEQHPEIVAQYYHGPDGNFIPVTYKDAYQNSLDFGAGLLSLGIKRGDRIGLISDNRKEWFQSDMGLMAIGAMKALTDMNVFHPVCGFDGITLMGYAGKNMTTVRQDFYDIGEEALRECIRLMGGESGRSIRVPYSLVQVRYEDVLT